MVKVGQTLERCVKYSSTCVNRGEWRRFQKRNVHIIEIIERRKRKYIYICTLYLKFTMKFTRGYRFMLIMDFWMQNQIVEK